MSTLRKQFTQSSPQVYASIRARYKIQHISFRARYSPTLTSSGSRPRVHATIEKPTDPYCFARNNISLRDLLWQRASDGRTLNFSIIKRKPHLHLNLQTQSKICSGFWEMTSRTMKKCSALKLDAIEQISTAFRGQEEDISRARAPFCFFFF